MEPPPLVTVVQLWICVRQDKAGEDEKKMTRPGRNSTAARVSQEPSNGWRWYTAMAAAAKNRKDVKAGNLRYGVAFIPVIL